MANSLIIGGARTPIGRLSGALGSFRASDLAGIAIAEALRRATVAPDEVDYVTLGQVLAAGQGQVPARQAAIAADIPLTVPATTVNKVCLSGLNAIHLADLMIRAGEAEIVVAGGMESMTQAPFLLTEARGGYRLGDSALRDSITTDGLTCSIEHLAMGSATESYAARAGIARGAMDEFAALSHQRAAVAIKTGRLTEEIVPVIVAQSRGAALTVDQDEGVRPDTSAESLRALRPVFSSDGIITAGNSSQISDGAAIVILASPTAAERLGVAPLGELIGYGQVAGPDPSLLTQPSRAIHAALKRAGRSLKEIDLFEINEAFAAVAIASVEDLGVKVDRVNVNGGAIALGHPIGMSGARLVLTLCIELARRGGGLGVAALCGGTGQGDAALVSVAA